MTVGGPDAFMPEAPAAETRIPLISDWSPNCCGEAPIKSAVRCVISDGAGLDTKGSVTECRTQNAESRTTTAA